MQLSIVVPASDNDVIGCEGKPSWRLTEVDLKHFAASLGRFAIVRVVLRAPVPIADRERFVFVPETTPVAEVLDPSTDREETVS